MKHPLESKTVWGLLIALMTILAPVLEASNGQKIEILLQPDVLGGIAAILYALYGRWVASGPLGSPGD